MTEQKDIEPFGPKIGHGDSSSSARAAASFNAVEFMHFLDGADWSDKEKSEYLALIWEIVCEFVMLGFDVHPLQQAQKNCGKPSKTGADKPMTDSGMIESSHSHLIEEFMCRSELETVSGEEGDSDG